MRLFKAMAMFAGAAFLAISMITHTLAAEGKQLAREDIEKIVREYLLKNPELLIEMSKALEAKQRIARDSQFQTNLRMVRAEVFGDNGGAILGNPNGKTVVVEFSDYNCPYCRRMAPLVKQAIKDNPDLKIVMREFPILGEGSQYAAAAALAAGKQDKYAVAHFALIAFKGRLTQTTVDKLMTSLGIDLARLKSDMRSPEIQAMTRQNLEFGELLGINGTPAFIAGDTLYPGALPPDQFSEMLEVAARNVK